MKNILTLLLVLASACLLGQTKEEAFDEMNAILKKLEGKTVTTIEGDGLIIAKQTVFPEYMFVVKHLDIVVGAGAKDIPWKSYISTEVKEDYGLSVLVVNFSKKFEFSMRLDRRTQDGSVNLITFYIPKEDIERFEALLKIVSGK